MHPYLKVRSSYRIATFRTLPVIDNATFCLNRMLSQRKNIPRSYSNTNQSRPMEFCTATTKLKVDNRSMTKESMQHRHLFFW